MAIRNHEYLINQYRGRDVSYQEKTMHEIVFAKIEGPVDKQLILVLK